MLESFPPLRFNGGWLARGQAVPEPARLLADVHINPNHREELLGFFYELSP